MRAESIARAATALWVFCGIAFLAGCAAPGTPTPPSEQDGAPPRPPDLSRIPDAVPQAESRSPRGNPPFYEVMGKRYYVMNSAAGYRERGIASWYGTKFHGRLTSSGEPYDMYAMTAAHKTLPLPSYVRVTHRGNGRSIVVRVNDRGPFVGDRIIDLSYAAAVRLGMHAEGTALVDVEAIIPGNAREAPLLAHADPTPPPSPAAWLQVGAFSDESNAARLKTQLETEGIHDVVMLPEARARERVYRVRIGPLATVDDIDRMLDRVRMLGIEDVHIAMD